MKRSVLIIFIFLIKFCTSQNLVPNGSFEDFSACPDLMSQLYLAVPWHQPTSGTPDYYNACSPTGPGEGVPLNYAGYQFAKTGYAYASFIAYSVNYPWTLREYVQVKLKDSLITGETYCISFYISLTDSSQYAISEIGAYFSDTSIWSGNVYNLPYTPQFYYSSGTFFSDKTKWYEISGSFIATNNSNYITIGNFKDDANTDSLYVGGAPGWVETILYIDDVSVYDCDAPVYVAEGGSNQTICIGKNDSVQIGTTPRNEYIYWWLPATGLSNDSIANPKASPAVTTTYYLHQKDFKFDETIDSVTVFVKANCDTASDDIYIPNIFSPNGDLTNDVLYVRSHNIKTMDFCIYNRWGEKVFETKDINKGWDGRYKNSKCNEGVFVYYLNATLKDDKQVVKKGNVTLIR